MAITANSGPYVAFGVAASTSVPEYNSQRGPSLFDCGNGILDPRPAYGYLPGAAVTRDVMGFLDNNAFVDAPLEALSTNAFATSSATLPVAGTAVTFSLLSSAGTGVKATTIIAPESGATVATNCIGSTAAFLAFGSDSTINIWNPAALAGRAVSVNTSSSGDTGGFTLAGRDVYGYKITETLSATDATRVTTGTSGYILTSLKTYKYLTTVVASTTITSTGVSIGYTNRIGLPLYAGANSPIGLTVAFGSSINSSAAAVILLTSAALALGSTTTATSTTGDVRGTYTSSVALGSTARLLISQVLSPAAAYAISTGDFTVAFGLTQYSSV